MSTDDDPDLIRIHTIPVPVGWSVEQAWTAVHRGDKLTHPKGEPGWANVQVDEHGSLVRVLPSAEQLRERATSLAQAAGVADELDELTDRLAFEAAAQAAQRDRTIDALDLAQALLVAMQKAVGEELDRLDPTPAAT